MPTEEQIRLLAYNLWEQGGKLYDKDWDYWFKARRTLEEKERGASVAPPAVQQTPSTTPPPATGRRASRGSRKTR